MFGLEVPRPGNRKSCDIVAHFPFVLFIEVKSQSGQQHGDKHPRIDSGNMFTPQSEEDLRSWLFEKRQSSKTGEVIIPQCIKASEKGADVLIAFMDVFQFETHDVESLGKTLVPDSQGINKTLSSRNFWKNLSLWNLFKGLFQLTGLNKEFLSIYAIKAGTKTSQKMGNLQEIWLLREAAKPEIIVIRSIHSNALLGK